MSTSLYRAHDSAGRLLYVGISDVPFRRFGQHDSDKAWWVDVETIALTHYDSRDDAIDAEAAAIENEAPVHNVRRPSASLPRERREELRTIRRGRGSKADRPEHPLVALRFANEPRFASAAALARAANVSAPTVCRAERGEPLGFLAASRIARVLGMSVSSLAEHLDDGQVRVPVMPSGEVVA